MSDAFDLFISYARAATETAELVNVAVKPSFVASLAVVSVLPSVRSPSFGQGRRPRTVRSGALPPELHWWSA